MGASQVPVPLLVVLLGVPGSAGVPWTQGYTSDCDHLCSYSTQLGLFVSSLYSIRRKTVGWGDELTGSPQIQSVHIDRINSDVIRFPVWRMRNERRRAERKMCLALSKDCRPSIMGTEKVFQMLKVTYDTNVMLPSLISIFMSSWTIVTTLLASSPNH